MSQKTINNIALKGSFVTGIVDIVILKPCIEGKYEAPVA